MATIQSRTTKSGIESHRVGYYVDGKLKWTPSMEVYEGAVKIKEIIETQGPAIALQILEAQQVSETMTLREWFPQHLAVRAIEVTDGTIAEYEREAERTWMDQLGDMPLEMITRQHVVDWVGWYMKQPTDRSKRARDRAEQKGLPLPPVELVKPKTVRNAHTLLSAVLQAAVEAEHIVKNVAHRVPLPKDDAEEEMEIFSPEEWDAFYTAMHDHYKPFIIFLLVTGLRMGEATGTRVRDLNPQAMTVSVVKAWKKGRTKQEYGTPKSARSRRTIMIPDWAMDVFLRLADGKGPDDLLFQSVRGGRIYGSNFGDRYFNKTVIKAGIRKDLTPHNLRHTFASWQLMKGVPQQVVQHRLGHESIATTSKVYAHLLLEAQQGATQVIEWKPPKELAA